MSRPPLAVGKLPPGLLRELIGGRERWPPELRLGPAVGEDACAIDVPAGVLIAATDPITLTGSEVGAHAVIVNANDVAVMGVRPRWFLAAVLLPAGSDAETARALFASLHRGLARVGAALVGGHTEVTPVVRQPLVVGQMLGLAEDGRFLATSGARAGDDVIQAGPAPVEGGAVLAAEAADRLGALPAAVREQARCGLDEPGISVVDAALEAAAQGASALHDPTEGGLAAGLHELADASGVALDVKADAVLWFEPARSVCRALGADPWGTLASGTLLAACPPARTAALLAALSARHLPGARIARARAGRGVWLGRNRPLPLPARDEVARVLSDPSPTPECSPRPQNV